MHVGRYLLPTYLVYNKALLTTVNPGILNVLELLWTIISNWSDHCNIYILQGVLLSLCKFCVLGRFIHTYLTFFIFTIWSNNGKTVLSFFNQLGVNLSKVYIHLTLWWRKGTSCTLLLWLNRPEIDKIYTYIGIIKYLKGKKEHSEKFAIQGEVTINNVLPGWHCMNSEYYCFI